MASCLTNQRHACGKTPRVPRVRCHECFKSARDTKTSISNGLRLIRIRFNIPYIELPDLEPDDLSQFLLFQLGGASRRPTTFPRRQSSCDDHNLVRLIRLGRRDRWEFAHSVNSLKRNLPNGCRFHTPSSKAAWSANAFSTPPPSSMAYLSFVRKEVRKIFPFGWDKRYEEFVQLFRPNPSNRFERCSSTKIWAERGRKEFLNHCLTGSGNPAFRARYAEVLSAGKNRPLVIFSSNIDVLGPLHKMLYSFMAERNDWLLVGPPTSRKINHLSKAKPYLTSIDLVAATDNLRLDVSEAILGALLAKSTRIPGNVKLMAFNSLYPEIDGRTVQHGQMMGGYLSFPLLCLHSWLAARWAVRHDRGAKILVNGDDTVIASSVRVTPEMYPEGYQINVSKTIWNASKEVEINSTVFLRQGHRWCEVHHLRRGSFLTDFAGMVHASASVRQSPVWENAFVRARFGRKWGFLPSQLGLFGEAAALKETSMRQRRQFTELPTPIGKPDTHLISVERDLDYDEKIRLNMYKFEHVDGEARKRDQFNPVVGVVRATYRYKKPNRWTLTPTAYMYRSQARSRNLRFVYADYESMRDRDELRLVEQELGRWTAD